ncbi:MAG: metallopeptidase TldD-related protein [Myxococcota bacterium]
MRTLHPLLVALSLLGSPSLAAPTPGSDAAAGEDDVLLQTAGAELERIWDDLSAQSEPAYWLSLGIIDRNVTEVQATHGSASEVNRYHSRLADVDLRVGDPSLDNTHKIRDAGWFSESPRPSVDIPITDEPDAIRMGIWRATDEAYRGAVKRLIKVRTNDAVKVAREDQSADFSDAAPVVSVGTTPPLDLDGAAWQQTIRELSDLFLEYPEVYDSNVSFRAQDDVHYVLTSEGTRIRHRRYRIRLSVWGSTVADDGMNLQVYDYIDAADMDEIPDREALEKMVRAVAARVTELRKAPLVEPYVGPAILRGRAAAVFFHEILGHRVEGHRQKDEDEGQTLTDKVGEPILPDFISVYDDPTLQEWEGTDLNGYYPYDDEGVAAQRVGVVEDGVLQSFLMSRAPIEGFAVSNGHGRRQPGSAVVARQGNLIVQADPKQTVSYDQLRRQLIREIKRQDKPFGLIFNDITGGFTFTGRSTPNSYSVQPVTVWKVYADGRPDELVRGVDMIGTPLITFSRIDAASDEYQVFNGVCGAESGWVPVAAIAPDLLVREVEVQRKEKGNDRPPLLPPPGVRATAENKDNG